METVVIQIGGRVSRFMINIKIQYAIERKLVTFTRTSGPSNRFQQSKFYNCTNNTVSRSLKNAFKVKKILLTTYQAPNSRKLLVTAKYNTNLIPAFPKSTGLFPCNGRIYH